MEEVHISRPRLHRLQAFRGRCSASKLTGALLAVLLPLGCSFPGPPVYIATTANGGVGWVHVGDQVTVRANRPGGMTYIAAVVSNDRTGQSARRLLPAVSGDYAVFPVDAADLPGLDLNGPKIQVFQVTVNSGHWLGEDLEASGKVNVLFDADTLPPANVPFLGGPASGEPGIAANAVISSFGGAGACVSRTAYVVPANVTAIGDIIIPAGTPGWEFVVTGSFPKQVVDGYTSRPTPLIATPKGLRFVVAPMPLFSAAYWCLANLEVFVDGDAQPRPTSTCVTSDPAASPPQTPATPEVPASAAGKPTPRP